MIKEVSLQSLMRSGMVFTYDSEITICDLKPYAQAKTLRAD